MRSIVKVCVGVLAIGAGVVAVTALAEPSATKDEQKKSVGGPVWPEIVKTKKLYAKNDYRGKAAPKFEVEKWLNDEPKREGKVVMIDFWATWCGPCRALIPELNGIQKEFKDDLVVIGVSDEAESKVKGFMEKTTVSYAMAIDTKAKMKNALAVDGIPHVMVVDSKGVVRWQGFPMDRSDPLTGEVLKKIIEADKAQRAGGAEKPKE